MPMRLFVYPLLMSLLCWVPILAKADVIDQLKGLLDRPRQQQMDAARKRLYPHLVIKDGLVTFNGKPLQFGRDINDAIRLLGPQYRATDNRVALTWDKLGIELDGRRGRLTEMTIHVNRDPEFDDPFLSDNGKYFAFTPKQAFPGYLEIDGVWVSDQTTIAEINQHKSGGKFTRKTSADRFGRMAEGGHHLAVSVKTENGRNTRIYSFTVYDSAYSDSLFQ